MFYKKKDCRDDLTYNTTAVIIADICKLLRHILFLQKMFLFACSSMPKLSCFLS